MSRAPFGGLTNTIKAAPFSAALLKKGQKNEKLQRKLQGCGR